MSSVDKIRVSAYSLPTDAPEADGTYEWESTTLVLVELSSGGKTGLGYSYADRSTAHFIDEHFRNLIEGTPVMDIPSAWEKMIRSIRNLGRSGVASMAISAVDNALWDLKARLLGMPLVDLLGRARERVPVYGSGGFTSYSIPALQKQLARWVRDGISSVKMKVGASPDRDVARVRAARKAIGDGADLFVDANGAYDRAQATEFAAAFGEQRVGWFEEPVTSDDLDGLRSLRGRVPGMDIAAGEYGYDAVYFRRMLDADAVDVMQADATRCAGITGFLRVAALCDAKNVPLSAHCAPSLHRHVCCAAPRVRHVEYFHDHERFEHLLFDGAATPKGGFIAPDLSKPGMGLELKKTEAHRYAVYGSH